MQINTITANDIRNLEARVKGSTRTRLPVELLDQNEANRSLTIGKPGISLIVKRDGSIQQPGIVQLSNSANGAA